jgi:hypothetical protein
MPPDGAAFFNSEGGIRNSELWDAACGDALKCIKEKLRLAAKMPNNSDVGQRVVVCTRFSG